MTQKISMVIVQGWQHKSRNADFFCILCITMDILTRVSGIICRESRLSSAMTFAIPHRMGFGYGETKNDNESQWLQCKCCWYCRKEIEGQCRFLENKRQQQCVFIETSKMSYYSRLVYTGHRIDGAHSLQYWALTVLWVEVVCWCQVIYFLFV